MRALDRLLAPSSVAVIAGRYAMPAIGQLRRIGYAGAIHVVSPTRSEIGGIQTVPQVADLPDGIDAAFVAVPAPACPGLVATLQAKGCGGVVCFSSEFAEAGERDLQAELVRSAGAMPLLGPNCHGLINGLNRVALWPDEHGVEHLDRGVAILSQSGNIAINFTMQQRSVPIGLVVSLGNQAQLGATPFLRHLARNPKVSAIGLHLEGVDDPAAFAEAALEVQAAGKPVVVLKTGRSHAGARATVTHTSTLAGSSRVHDAFFGRLGIAQASSIAGFLETLKFLHVHGRRPGRRICSLSCSGGEAALVADLAEAQGLELPRLSAARSAVVAASLDHRVVPDNPMDYHTFIWGSGQRLTATFSAYLAENFDTSLLVLDYPTRAASDLSSWDITLESWIAAAKSVGCAAAVVATLPECFPDDRRRRSMEAGIVPLQGIAEAIEAIAAASLPPPVGKPVRVLPQSKPGPVRQLDEAAAKSMLARAGLAVPAGRLAVAKEAASVAVELGWPVVVKTANPVIAHKSDVGGVAVGLESEDSVSAAAMSMAHLGDRVLVERMIVGTVAEMIVGVARDPQFGPVLVIGAGGVLAELMDDSATLLFPVERADVEKALEGLRVARLLKGYRGRPPGDRIALVEAVLAIAAFVEDHVDCVVELDVNPLLVLPQGQGVVAADVLLRMVD
ncbi:MAG TPA: acetate--CoA ligase family protein [Geminicoccus sp.]|jgi:acetyl-CoA synthetase|uniref:acetate--CoA ligase family protein n=1 Tax=Geminicoccus sp. TaxID=2024832 RepID=UPI002E35703A|nr:acetate--CoA ligase family protein [Geminicoccus sp.]HEX2526474.1 acetate--CoA ligase family protein [Geminicoccus sp.]